MELEDLPEDEAQKHHLLLLPATPNPAELWPAILTKAILKVAALEYVTLDECNTGIVLITDIHIHVERL